MALITSKNSEQCSFDSVFLSNMSDPRRTTKGNLQHNFGDILFLVISAVICGITDWDGIEMFGKNQISWLRKFRNFDNGIPKHDTLNRVISALNPEKFNECFINWINNISAKNQGDVVAIDGKTIRGSACKVRNISPIHIVSAYAARNELCIGQLKTDQKSNEITAIPKLLDLIAIEGCTITIDAMGCQTDIADKIRKKKAHYILAVKGNQGTLEQEIIDTIRFSKPKTINIEDDFGHGRIEKRSCFVYDDLTHISTGARWTDLKTIVKIESEVFVKATGKSYTEERLYISSLELGASYMNNAIRNHWAVENKLHWNLDVIFGEDSSRKRVGYAAENMNIILKMSLSMLQKENSTKLSKKKKMQLAALDPNYREVLLNL